MPPYDEHQRQLDQMTHDFRGAIAALTALVNRNEAEVESAHESNEKLRAELHEIDKKLAVVISRLDSTNVDTVHARVDAVRTELLDQVSKLRTEAMRLVRQVEKRVGDRKDATPLAVPHDRSVPDPAPEKPKKPFITQVKEAITLYSGAVATAIAISVGIAQQCGGAKVEPDGHGGRQLVMPVPHAAAPAHVDAGAGPEEYRVAAYEERVVNTGPIYPDAGAGPELRPVNRAQIRQAPTPAQAAGSIESAY